MNVEEHIEDVPELHLSILAPDKVLMDGSVQSIVAPGAEGELGILPNHANLISPLEQGLVRVVDRIVDGEPVRRSFLVHGGFLQVRDNSVTILAEIGEPVEKIDAERAEAAKKRAEDRLATRSGEIDQIRAEMALKKALLRLNASGGGL